MVGQTLNASNSFKQQAINVDLSTKIYGISYVELRRLKDTKIFFRLIYFLIYFQLDLSGVYQVRDINFMSHKLNLI